MTLEIGEVLAALTPEDRAVILLDVRRRSNAAYAESRRHFEEIAERLGESHAAAIATLTAERDAAVRARDAALAVVVELRSPSRNRRWIPNKGRWSLR